MNHRGLGPNTSRVLPRDSQMPKLYKPFTPAEDALLGTMSDHRLAKRLKRKHAEVYGRRRELLIEPYGAWSIRWGTLNLSLLGAYPDAEVAKIIGCKVETVKAKRESIGRPSCSKS